MMQCAVIGLVGGGVEYHKTLHHWQTDICGGIALLLYLNDFAE